MKGFLFLISFLAILPALYGQEPDTTRGRAPASWKKMELAPRVVFGVQKGFFIEAGAGFQRYGYDPRLGFEATAIYTSVEWMPGKGNDKGIYGVKAGVESVYNGGAGGIEIKYLANSDEQDFVITPRIGFGIGLVNLFYGYNFSTNKYPFDRIRKHQFSLVINTNLIFYHNKYEKK